MTAMTQFLQKKLIDHTLGIASWTMPTTVYMSLHTADPGETGSHVAEVSGNNYARQSLSGKMAATVLTSGISTLSASVTFATPSASWGLVTHIGIEDAATSGNMLLKGRIVSSRTVSQTNVFKLEIGQFEVRFD